jgi:hypothetical protein
MNTLQQPKKSKRFFYHYNKAASRATGCTTLTLHWENTCHMINWIVLHVGSESHAQKRQPNCVIRGWANDVQFTKTNAGVIAVVR